MRLVVFVYMVHCTLARPARAQSEPTWSLERLPLRKCDYVAICGSEVWAVSGRQVLRWASDGKSSIVFNVDRPRFYSTICTLASEPGLGFVVETRYPGVGEREVVFLRRAQTLDSTTSEHYRLPDSTEQLSPIVELELCRSGNAYVADSRGGIRRLQLDSPTGTIIVTDVPIPNMDRVCDNLAYWAAKDVLLVFCFNRVVALDAATGRFLADAVSEFPLSNIIVTEMDDNRTGVLADGVGADGTSQFSLVTVSIAKVEQTHTMAVSGKAVGSCREGVMFLGIIRNAEDRFYLGVDHNDSGVKMNVGTLAEIRGLMNMSAAPEPMRAQSHCDGCIEDSRMIVAWFDSHHKELVRMSCFLNAGD